MWLPRLPREARRSREERRRAAVERSWRQGIDEHGWLVLHVPDGDDGPFHYTAGLTERALPEIIVYSLTEEQGAFILNSLAERLLNGQRFADGADIHDLIEGYRAQLWDATDVREPLGAAYCVYGADNVSVRQLVLPDFEDRLPWDPGFDDTAGQPLLFAPPAP